MLVIDAKEKHISLYSAKCEEFLKTPHINDVLKHIKAMFLIV